MSKRISGLVCASVVALSGCTGGTTYGTGKTHEEATLKSMYNILSVKAEQTPTIDYSARPDLVMPASKEVLPAPDSSIEQADGQAWPVSPEQRIAAVRDAAPGQDIKDQRDRQDPVPSVEYLNSEKEGIRNSSGLYAASRANSKADPNFIGMFVKDQSPDSAGAEVRRRREQLAYSTGPQRKFLTEPPAEYRRPAETADASDLGFDSDFIEERRQQEREQRVKQERGVVDVRGANE